MSKVAKTGLKFVKKRVAGHKRSAEDIEDEAYERELAIQAAREAGLTSNVHASHQVQTVLPPKPEDDELATAQAAQPQDPAAKKSSEDWEMFNKLLGKVETTVQSTVQTIEKVKETSVVQEIIAKEKASQIVIPEYKGVKSFEEAKREKEEREREALRQRRDADDWERAFDAASGKNQAPDVLLLGDPEEQPKLSFAHYSPSSGPSAIPKTPIEVDPFDTTFISPVDHKNTVLGKTDEEDPFDTKEIVEKIEAVDKQTQRRLSLSGSVNPFGLAGIQDDPNPRVRPPTRPSAGSSLFSSTDCSPVDIPDEVQNFFKNHSRRSSTNPFDPSELAISQPLSTEDTIRTGAALLQAIASEFVNKDDDDDDLFNRTLGGKSQLPPPSPISPFSEPEQTVPVLMDIGSTFESSVSEAAASSVDPFTVAGANACAPPLAPEAVPAVAPPAAPVDAFRLAFGKKSIDLDDVPPQAQTELPLDQVPQALKSVKDSFDPFKGVQRGLELPSSIPDPVSGAPTPGSDVFENQLRQQEEEFFGPKTTDIKSSPEQAPVPTRPPQSDAFEDRRRDSSKEALTQDGSLAGLQESVPAGDRNPFSPKNSPPTENVPSESVPVVDNPFSASAPPPRKSITSPENPFAPKPPSPPKGSDASDRRASEDSNPFSPTSRLPPVTVGANNPFGDDPEPTMPVEAFSSVLATSPLRETTASTLVFTNASADPFDTANIVPATDQGALDAFASKFAQIDDTCTGTDAFGGSIGSAVHTDISGGFGGDQFQVDGDFLGNGGIPIPQVPDNTPVKIANLGDSKDSFDDEEEEEHMKITIRPKLRPLGGTPGVPSLAAPPKLIPPPKSPSRQAGYQVQPDRFNPFDKGALKTAKTNDEQLFNAFEDALNESKAETKDDALPPALGESGSKQAEPLSPSTPLFDEDTTQPLSEWKPKRDLSDGWEFYLRWPNKKKFTGTRYWKPVYVKFNDATILWIMNKKDDSDPIQEVPLQGCYSLSEMAHQPLDQFKKIFTIKLQYTFYKETVGVRKGQIAKVISGQVNSMGSVAKLGLPLQHAPQLNELLKLGTPDIETIRTFVQVIEDVLFGLQIHRDRALTYKAEEIQAMVVDEYVVEVDKTGHVCSQKARVRLFFLAFVNGMPDVEVGINELTRQGKEVVGRHDIMPIVTEEWIRVEDYEFHSCVERQEFEDSKVIKLRPPDATFFELMRFRVRPPRQRELPIQLTAVLKVNAPKVQLKAEVLVPGYSSRKHGQIPCEEIAMFFPIPECWVYLFRVERHFRYGALKSTNRRHGKIKGLERIMGAAAGGNIDKQLIEVTAGQAKYEPAHRAIVWRVSRLPKEGQGAYTQQMMTVDLELTSFDQIPTEFDSQLRVEFTMPASTVSHTTIRSISCPTDADLPVEKFCRYVAKHEYKVEMDVQVGSGPIAPPPPVTRVEAKEPVPGTPPPMVRQTENAGSDSEYSD